jgi:type VI secretion system secreted protein Hcp
MAFDCFLKIDGIDGESQDDRHAREIDVLSFSWGESNAGAAAHGGGAGAGKVSMQDFHFTMRFNRASPLLARACATGQHIRSAVLTCRKPGASAGASAAAAVVPATSVVDVGPVDAPVAAAGDGFIKFTLTDLLVSSYKTGAGPQPNLAPPSTGQAPPIGDERRPIDAVTIDFAKIEMEVRVQKPDGSLGEVVRAGWDLTKNARV